MRGAGGQGSRGDARGRRPKTIQEGGGSGEQAAMEVGEPPKGGGPRQYRRAEVAESMRPWK